MNKKELSKKLNEHQHWLNAHCDGHAKMKANLSCADLSGTNLSGVNLSYADLSGANLSCADLSGADLSGADLRNADLKGANLKNVNLRDANLKNADLRSADLRDADLRDANLKCANLKCTKNIPFVPYACPEIGSFIGYKKAGEYIIELEILADAKRSSATSRKCRCNKAKVLRILDMDRTEANILQVESERDKNFVYKVGEIVKVDDFDENRWNECSTGIHFFVNFQEAVRN